MAIDYIVAKEDYDEYMEIIKNLQTQLQQKENIIKEVREYVENENIDVCTIRYNDIQDVKKELLEILDKGE